MSKNSTAQSQRAKIRKYLRENRRLSTLKAREELGIMHPAARVLELRAEGNDIKTLWRIEHDSTGMAHRIAEYVLFVGGSEAANDPTY